MALKKKVGVGGVTLELNRIGADLSPPTHTHTALLACRQALRPRIYPTEHTKAASLARLFEYIAAIYVYIYTYILREKSRASPGDCAQQLYTEARRSPEAETRPQMLALSIY